MATSDGTGGERSPLELSAVQKLQWVLEQLAPAARRAHAAIAVDLRGDLDVARLQRAWASTVADLDALRLEIDRHRPVQRVLELDPGLPVHPVEHDALARWLTQRMDVAGEDGRTWDAALARVAPDHHVLHVRARPIAADDAALGLAMEHLAARFSGDTPARARPFAEYLEAQATCRTSSPAQAPGPDRLDPTVPPIRPYGLASAGDGSGFERAPCGSRADIERALAGSRVHGADGVEDVPGSRVAAFGTAVAAYTHRVTGNRAILVCVRGAQRRPEFARTVGPVADEVFLSLSIDEDDTIATLRDRLVNEWRAATPPRGAFPVGRPTPHVVLNFVPAVQARFPGLAATVHREPAPALTRHPRVSMGAVYAFHVFEEDGGVPSVQVEFDSGCFDPIARSRALSHFGRILRAVGGEPGPRAPLGELPLLDDDERGFVAGAARGRDAGTDAPDVVARITEQCATAARVAVVGADETLTYGALEARTNALARRLVAEGVGRESRVGVALPRGAGELVALLSTLKAGGAYVPLEAAHPMERVRTILEDAAPDVLLVSPGSPLVDAAPRGTRLVVVEDLARATAGFDDAPLALPTSPDQLAYILFTSGSTGRPKGVEVTRGALANFLRSMAHAPGLSASDTLLAITTTTFDISGLELLLPLYVGAQVAIADRETASDPGLLRGRLESGVFTCMQATPATWRLLIDAGWRGDARLRMLCGGEAMPPDLAAQLLERGRELWNLYGPTETTIWSTVGRVEAAHPISIGRPIDRTSVYVLDGALGLSPVGVPGQLYIGGHGVARGYRGRPDLTTERFVRDPYAPDGGRMYCTGDVGRLLPDGRFECLGRVDHQVKIRGFRIELGEIEAVLRNGDGVKDVVVITAGREHEPRLVAYVVGSVDRESLVARARRHLPSYMVPSAFVFVPALPLTTSGKVDRRALPPHDDATVTTPRSTPPRNESEARLATIWSEVLRRPSVGVEEELFEVGATALAALEVRDRIEQRWGVLLPVSSVVEARTVAALSRCLTEAIGAAPRAGAHVTEAAQFDCEASSIERQFWFLQRLAPDTRAYHIPSVFRIRGPLDVSALQRAFDDLVARHAILRTTFAERDGALRQTVHSTGSVEFRCLDGAARGDDDRVRAELERPFDLEHGPLIRVALWRRAADDHVLAWTMHHVVTDLATKSLFAHELAERYALHRRGLAPRVVAAPPAAQSYAFARWEREWLGSDAARQAEEYFARHLATPPPPLALPEDHPRPAVQSARGGRVTFELPPALAARLQQRAREWQSKPFLVLFTAYALLLARHGRTQRVAIGVPFSNRRREAVQGTAGCLVNTLPVVVDVDGRPTFVELLRRVRATFLGHHRHQELPLERIVARCRTPRDPSRNPLYQAGFTFQPPLALSLEGVEVTSDKAHAGGAQLDVFLTLWEHGSGFAGELEYCADLFEHATIQRLVRRYEAILRAALEDDAAEQVAVDRLDMLDASERELVLRTWNATDATYDAPARLDELFLQQVRRTPDAVALQMGGRQLTYRELMQHASALTRELGDRGVVPGDRVGIFMERSFEMVTAIYATILSGAAYVPLDPEYPPHRVQLMLEDAQPRCVLTHAPTAARWSAAEVPTIPVALGARAPAGDPTPARGGPDDAAYVIFTSGSTGRPKGVANSHRGIANRILWMQQAFALTPDDVVLHKTPFGFDVSVWELFWPLCAGARLEIAPPQAHRDPKLLTEIIRGARVTTLHFVPPMLGAFLEHPAAGSCTSLRRIVCSGEALKADLVQRCCDLLPAELDNLYGPTEAAVDVSWWRCRDDLSRNPVPIGRPIANTRLYVLDEHLEPLPVGVPGELYIGGVQVALGYVNRPDLTRERFPSDPFASVAGARMYRTGDRARWSADGTVEFLGRLDHQLKIRGMRIEPAEIEAAIDSHPSVRRSVVVAHAENANDPHLVAHVALRAEAPGGAAVTHALRRHVAERIPGYMVPHTFLVVQDFPLTASGKVDHKALGQVPIPVPPPDTSRPTSDVQRWMLEELDALLGHRVGLRENFFDAGVTSLTAAQLMTRIRRRFGSDVPLVRVFEHPNVEALAAHLTATCGDAPAPDAADGLAKARGRAELRRAHRPRPGHRS